MKYYSDLFVILMITTGFDVLCVFDMTCILLIRYLVKTGVSRQCNQLPNFGTTKNLCVVLSDLIILRVSWFGLNPQEVSSVSLNANRNHSSGEFKNELLKL